MDSTPNEQHFEGHPSEDNLEQVEMDMEESEQGSISVKDETSDPYPDSPRQKGDDKDSLLDNNNSDRYFNSKLKTNIIQITNICPSATIELVSTMFGMLGNIANISLYHYNHSQEYNFKVCFVEYSKQTSVLMAQHLTNVVLIDRAIIVLPYNKSEIQDRDAAFPEGLEYVTMFNPGFVHQVTTGAGGTQMIATSDSKLTATGLSPYPHLPLNTEPTRIEEIRRTLYIGNLDSTVPSDQVMKFFNDLGEVKFIRIAGDETQPTRFAFVEYTHQSSVMNALQQNGSVLGSRPLKINHSNNSIVKPQPRIEVDISMKRARDRSTSREYGSRDRSYHSSRRHRDRYHDSSRSSRSRRSRSRDNSSRSRRSRSRDYSSRRSPSRDYRSSSRRRRKSRESSKRYRSRSRSDERHSRRNKSRR